MQIVKEIIGLLSLPLIRNAIILVLALLGAFVYYENTTGLWVLGIAFGVFVVAAIAYFWYLNRLYNTTYKPQLIPGIPAIPVAHPIHGHYDLAMSPAKHILRWDAFRKLIIENNAEPVLQQIYYADMRNKILEKRISLHFFDANEAHRLINDNEMFSKGLAHTMQRANPGMPDMISSDGEDYKLRRDLLREGLEAMRVPDETMHKICAAFNSYVGDYVDKSDTISLHKLAYMTALDSVCNATFDYPLNSLGGSQEGIELYDCLYLQDEVYNVANGMSAETEINEEKVKKAQVFYAGFIAKLHDHVTSGKSNNAVVKALHKLLASTSDNHVKSEIHVLFDHGVRLLAATIAWTLYSLAMYRSERTTLETAMTDSTNPDSIKQINAFIKEVFRMFPPATFYSGIRTVESEYFRVKGGVEIPKGTVCHFDMFFYHNKIFGLGSWADPRTFDSSRWMRDMIEAGKWTGHPSHPKCPFAAMFNVQENDDHYYEGVGFTEGSLSYFPFSAGERSCPAKGLVLQTVRGILHSVLLQYRLDLVNIKNRSEYQRQEYGYNLRRMLWPINKESTVMKVTKYAVAESEE